MDTEFVPLTSIPGQYALQLYSDPNFTNQYCRQRNLDNAASLRSANVPSRCINMIFPGRRLGDQGHVPDDVLEAKFFGFVNDPTDPGRFKLCAYSRYNCDGTPYILLGRGYDSYVADTQCHQIPGFTRSSLRVVGANDDCAAVVTRTKPEKDKS